MNLDREVVNAPTIDEYRGNALIILPLGDGESIGRPTRDFSFGLGKAKAILRHIKAIEKFVNSDGKEV